MYGGQGTNLPIKMNMAGVMPIIFASSIVSIPATIVQLFGISEKNGFGWFVDNYLQTDTWVYIILYLVLLVAFSYFYIMISFNPVEVANNIRNNGGAIPGIRPGRPTSDFIKKVLNKITLIGAGFLAVVAGLPMIVGMFSTQFASLAFGGSSLLIIVGVALETIRDLEAQITMRNYKGFLD
jgi:preprotein translocase subunit SecY